MEAQLRPRHGDLQEGVQTPQCVQTRGPQEVFRMCTQHRLDDGAEGTVEWEWAGSRQHLAPQAGPSQDHLGDGLPSA